MAVLIIFKVDVPVFTYKLYLCEYMQHIGSTVSQQHYQVVVVVGVGRFNDTFWEPYSSSSKLFIIVTCAYIYIIIYNFIY